MLLCLKCGGNSVAGTDRHVYVVTRKGARVSTRQIPGGRGLITPVEARDCRTAPLPPSLGDDEVTPTAIHHRVLPPVWISLTRSRLSKKNSRGCTPYSQAQHPRASRTMGVRQLHRSLGSTVRLVTNHLPTLKDETLISAVLPKGLLTNNMSRVMGSLSLSFPISPAPLLHRSMRLSLCAVAKA